MAPKPIGVILAGGRGSRLGGLDKGLLEINGRKLIERCVTNIQPQVSAIVINANRNLPIYCQYADFVVPDMTKDYPGPLTGILSVMRYLESTQYPISSDLVTVPCDMPLLPPNLVAKFYTSRLADKGGNERIVVAHDGQRLQPLCALLPFSMKDRLEQFLASGHRKALDWIQYTDAMITDFSGDAATFANINTEDDAQSITASINNHV